MIQLVLRGAFGFGIRGCTEGAQALVLIEGSVCCSIHHRSEDGPSDGMERVSITADVEWPCIDQVSPARLVNAHAASYAAKIP